MTSSSSSNVGILALQVYTPRTYCRQEDLERHSQVPAGKYTAGLGQDGLAVVAGDAEDINSICLTAVQQLLESYNIDTARVGRLEVGTETVVDKSKSTKTVLMDLFPHTDMEGCTVVNACYGGTAALWNAIHWCQAAAASATASEEKRDWAIVVAADIATYAAGPARPTCGCGAVAVLVGPDAPLVPTVRATHAAHTWDFYKPNPATEYPTVDGILSQECYYQALHDVYGRLADKVDGNKNGSTFTATTPDYWVFHAPYNKLVQKSYGRLFLHDAHRKQQQTNNDDDEKKLDSPDLADWADKTLNETYSDKALEKVLKSISKKDWEKRLGDANFASKIVGNTYTASVFLGMASLIDRQDLRDGNCVGVFSYGSGAIATMYLMQVRQPTSGEFSVARMKQAMDLTNRLASREVIDASELDMALDTRARMHHRGAPYKPVYPSNRLFPGTFYLQNMDEKWRRTYARVPKDAVPKTGGPLAPPCVLALDSRGHNSKVIPTAVSCLITGIAAGLPGQEEVFAADNIERLLDGKQCIAAVSDEVKAAMLEKNIIQQKRLPDKTTKLFPMDKPADMIQLSAQLGGFDLTDSYGVPIGLAKTMDVAAQVALAAGMEALKNAGLVSGQSNDPAEWRLPEEYCDTTGVVYASSFPAMDAAIGEVMRFLHSRTVGAADSMRLVSALRQRLVDAAPEGRLADEDEEALARLLVSARSDTPPPDYAFDRKFLFRVLVLGNSQLAQLAGCRGPNTQTNAACAGTTQAIAMAQDMLVAGRADRVVVIAGDNASGDTLMPWLGSGFRVLGAATNKDIVEEAALPFDKRRSGMLLGAGGIGFVLETHESVKRRSLTSKFYVQARLLATQYSNSAFHGAALDRKHIATELIRFLNTIEAQHGITKDELCSNGVYFSHETCTHASDASSCSGNEVAALRQAFGDELLSKLLILNTKGYTGHPMGVSFEDVTAVAVLKHQRVPALPNHKVKDDYLGDLKLSRGGDYPCRYALRFAAGFGSQVAFALYESHTR